MIDTLHTYDTLKEGEIPDRQARAMTLAIKNAETAIALDVKAVIDQRFDEIRRYLEARFDQIDAGFEQIDGEFEQLGAKFATKTDLAVAVAELNIKQAQMETRLVRWMFLFWVSQLAVVVTLIKLNH